MVPVLLDLGPITIYSFGALLALAFLMGGYVVSLELDRKGMNPEHAWTILFWAAVGGLVGARLWVVTYDPEGFLDRPVAFLLSGSGFIWYGGLAGGFIAVSLWILRRGLAWGQVVDATAPSLALAHAIGRVGCQVSGDGDWGVPTSLPWGMSYPDAVIGWEAWTRANGLPPDVRVHPAPVYETLLYAGVFLVLWSVRTKPLRDGSMLWLYLLMSSIARFVVEFVRVEPVVAVGLTQAQWIAVVLVGLSLVLLARPGTVRQERTAG